jgi:IclR family transcriptional regulator, acetate operon repressor
VDSKANQAVQPGSVRAVERALVALEALSRSPDGITASDLARSIGLSTSTTHRLLVTLEGRGFASSDGRTFLWRVGRAASFAGSALPDKGDPTVFALPVLRELGRAIGETVNLGSLENGKLMFLARFEPGTGYCSTPGPSQLPGHCSSIGKAILSSEREPRLPAGLLPALTPNSVRTPSALLRQLQRCGSRGSRSTTRRTPSGCVASPLRFSTTVERPSPLSLSPRPPRGYQSRTSRFAGPWSPQLRVGSPTRSGAPSRGAPDLGRFFPRGGKPGRSNCRTR